MGGDARAADQAGARITQLEAELTLTADQQRRRHHHHRTPVEDGSITSTARSLPPSTSGSPAAESASELTTFARPSIRPAWDAADVETRRAIILFAGMQITTLHISQGNDKENDTAWAWIKWEITQLIRLGREGPRNPAGHDRVNRRAWSVRSRGVTKGHSDQSPYGSRAPMLSPQISDRPVKKT